MSKPRLLDLFCGAGGAAMGYHRAGFEVVGVDVVEQPHYPFEFHCGDAMHYLECSCLADFVAGFDAIHASPPCQAYTAMRNMGKGAGDGAPDLVDATRKLLTTTGLPWVIENVVGSPVRTTVRLCASSFGLHMWRHRNFESSLLLMGPPPCRHGDWRPIAVLGDHPQNPGTETWRLNRARTLDIGRDAMGIDWMDWRELTQAVPPAYTEWIGTQLLSAIKDPAGVTRRGPDATAGTAAESTG